MGGGGGGGGTTVTPIKERTEYDGVSQKFEVRVEVGTRLHPKLDSKRHGGACPNRSALEHSNAGAWRPTKKGLRKTRALELTLSSTPNRKRV